MLSQAWLSLCVLTLALPVAAQAPSSSFVSGSQADEAAIRAVMKQRAADKADPHVAADLDWENAFGVRYNNLQKMTKFYGEVVTPLQQNDTDTTLEVKVKFITPEIAVSDEYWHIVGQLDANTGKPGPDRWGRTTYLFKKENGSWTEVLERVADLRIPYYKHYDTLPAAAAVPAATLATYAGTYERTPAAKNVQVTVSGDHLEVVNKHGKFVAIPTSATEFLVFDPDDLSEYTRYTFASDGTKIKVAYPEGGFIADLTRVK